MARRSSIQGRNNNAVSLPSPVDGWNARDTLASMKPTEAVTLINMFPAPTNVLLRGGSSAWATGLPDQVETLMTYADGSSQQFFAASGTAIYDVSAGGAVGAPVVSGLTNARWQYTNISTPGGSFISLVNGSDPAMLYDGTSWTTPSITNVSSSTFTNVCLWKSRLWYVQGGSLKAWYLPTSSIAGAAQQLDLGSVAQRGGHLVAIGTWTIDAGYGADDNLVFVTSRGEVIVYRGTDPASASTFALVGVWFLGIPIGQRCLIKYGGDLLLMTYFGLLPLSEALQSAVINLKAALTDVIQGAFTDAASAYGGDFGWQMLVDTANQALYVNVPVGSGRQEQYVMNTTTQAWCQFQGWPANCWEMFNEEPYFGGNTTVYRAWDQTYSDASANINTNILQAFNYFGARGTEKYFTRVRPTIFSDGSPAIFIGMNVNFDTSNISAPLSFSPGTQARWDTAVWDADVWADGLTVSYNYQGITGIGYCGGVNFRSASAGTQIQWAATDIVYQNGWPGI